MMRTTKIIVLAMLLVGGVGTMAQQNAQYSQYMFNGIYINPAYAGYKEQLNAHSFYRNQWTGMPGAPKSMSLAIDAVANQGNVGLALQISTDKIGAQHTAAGYANYAYRLRLNDDGSSRLALGFGLGAVQIGIDGASLNPNDFEEKQPLGMQSFVVPDARVGIYYSNDKFYGGISADNLISNRKRIQVSNFLIQTRPHYYLTAGMLIPLSQDIQLKPSFLLRDDRGGPTSLDLNTFFLLADRVWLGGGYRTGVKLYDKKHLQNNLNARNSMLGAIEIFPKSNLRIGYAYDMSIGALQGFGGNTHELSLGIYFNTKKARMVSPRYF